MKLPLIKHLVGLIEDKDLNSIHQTISTLESLADAPSLKDEEIDVIGELLSNMYGALEVHGDILTGTSKKDALNGFMKRVLGSIDK